MPITPITVYSQTIKYVQSSSFNDPRTLGSRMAEISCAAQIWETKSNSGMPQS